MTTLNESYIARETQTRCPKCGGPSIPHYDEKIQATGMRICLNFLTCSLKAYTADDAARIFEAKVQAAEFGGRL